MHCQLTAKYLLLCDPDKPWDDAGDVHLEAANGGGNIVAAIITQLGCMVLGAIHKWIESRRRHGAEQKILHAVGIDAATAFSSKRRCEKRSTEHGRRAVAR